MIIMENTKQQINKSRDVADIMAIIYRDRLPEDQGREFVYTVGLDSKNRIIYINLDAMGTVNFAVPIVREIMRMAILRDVTALIAVHNHPSGDVRPSSDDRMFTKRLREAGDILQIKILDHVIIPTGEENGEIYSFRESENWS